MAVLVRDFGDPELAEDCAQDAFIKAGQRWGTSEPVPAKPAAWLTTVARRRALDVLRRSASYADKLAELEVKAKRGPERSPSRELVDDQLTLLLGCCHPALNLEAQVALTLRLVAGLSTAQIASGFLVSEVSMSKRITRAKAKIRHAGIPFEPVDAQVLRERSSAVLHVIYLIFTEGHSSRSAEEFVRGDLCDEAAWLASLVARLMPEDSESHGLHALVLLTDARRSTRVGHDGVPTMLENQDRSKWDRAKIASGVQSLSKAIERGPLGTFGLQALVASLHATAPTFEATDWPRIVSTYDLLAQLTASPVVELNRAVAISYVDGPGAGLAAMEPLEDLLGDYLYLHSASAELLRRLGEVERSMASYRRALMCEPSRAERDLLSSRLATLDTDLGTGPAV